jgi:uridine phosphorylase
MQKIAESELILNEDGSVYHLNLLPEDVADTVIIVGDPGRVAEVTQYFDHVEVKKKKREFVTHVGHIGKKRITVLSTGISTDNIDIVFNELDALVNINLKDRSINPTLRTLDIIRIGTAGGLQADIPVDSFVISDNAIGLESLANFYQLSYDLTEIALRDAFIEHFDAQPLLQSAYAINGTPALTQHFGTDHISGITVTCGGFYGPQGRVLRAQPMINHFVQQLEAFHFNQTRITNFEMETAGIYAMGKLLGHRCCSLSAIVANRCTGDFSKDMAKTVDNLIKYTLEKLTSSPVAVTSNIA